MRDLLRRADPAFYAKEHYVMRTEAQIARFTEEAQAEARLAVLRADGAFYVISAIVALATIFAALGAGGLGLRASLWTALGLAVLAAAAGFTAPFWLRRPQLTTWVAFAIVLLACALSFAFNASALAPRMPVEIAAIAVAYLGICIIAGRIRRAELIARPEGLLSLPQSIVPLLDRSHDHAIICWYE